MKTLKKNKQPLRLPMMEFYRRALRSTIARHLMRAFDMKLKEANEVAAGLVVTIETTGEAHVWARKEMAPIRNKKKATPFCRRCQGVGQVKGYSCPGCQGTGVDGGTLL